VVLFVLFNQILICVLVSDSAPHCGQIQWRQL